LERLRYFKLNKSNEIRQVSAIYKKINTAKKKETSKNHKNVKHHN